MPNFPSRKLYRALELARKNQQHLLNMALRSTTEFGYKNYEVVIICAEYNDFWEEFITGLNPQTPLEAESLSEKGLDPVAILATTINSLADYLTGFRTDICIPQEKPDDCKIWLLTLHETNHNWIQISIPPAPKLLC